MQTEFSNKNSLPGYLDGGGKLSHILSMKQLILSSPKTKQKIPACYKFINISREEAHLSNSISSVTILKCKEPTNAKQINAKSKLLYK